MGHKLHHDYLRRPLLADDEPREGAEGAETRGADGVAEREPPKLGDEWLTLGALGRYDGLPPPKLGDEWLTLGALGRYDGLPPPKLGEEWPKLSAVGVARLTEGGELGWTLWLGALPNDGLEGGMFGIGRDGEYGDSPSDREPFAIGGRSANDGEAWRGGIGATPLT